MLFPVQTLFLERFELGVSADPEMLSWCSVAITVGGFGWSEGAEGAEMGVGGVGVVDDGEFGRHGGSWGASRRWGGSGGSRVGKRMNGW